MSTPFPVYTFWGQGFNFLGTGFLFFGDRDFPAGTGIFRGFGGSGTGCFGFEVKKFEVNAISRGNFVGGARGLHVGYT